MRVLQDRESEARFGAPSVPGKMGAAMANTGFSTPPPRSAFAGNNPGNQLYVGNVRPVMCFFGGRCLIGGAVSCPTKLAGKT